ncbi:MAG: XdhC family protein, partial [Pseudomonadota bacterium]
GLIGSKTKRARFERTMRDLGIDQALIDRVVCPIGLPGIDSKQPAVIAVATTAQILALADPLAEVGARPSAVDVRQTAVDARQTAVDARQTEAGVRP